MDPAVINTGFLSTLHDWDNKMAQSNDRLQIYCQALLVGLKVAAREPTNCLQSLMSGRSQRKVQQPV